MVMDVLDKIEKLMVEHGIKASELAKKTGLPHSTIGGLFAKRRKPRISTLEKIASVFHLTLGEFFEEDIDSNEPKLIEIKFKKLSKKTSDHQ